MQKTEHQPVLLKETIKALDIQKNDCVFDGTIGLGGHSKEILLKLGAKGRIVGTELSKEILERCQDKLGDNRLTFINGNFVDIDKILRNLNINKINKVFLDLGLNTSVIKDSKKGFTFNGDESLIMTFGEKGDYPFTAEDIVNTWEEESLIDILKGYGEERWARRIVKKIIEVREVEKITTTKKLVDIIEDAVPLQYKFKRIHPATKTFQALRITVNNELEVLKEFLKKIETLMEDGGVVAIISFHSLEDRIVKRAFKDWKDRELGEILTKRPITATDSEIADNPKSRSAKLRYFKYDKK